ncbi:type III secretion system protein [Vibrio mediterranei]|uniref:Type III secretion system protein n=1 Tax=Vibrio mediterranei TaxID=689 RepID=A0A3G4VKZ2_9VIBR|nr:type III secretion system protein [Vibrio mediterranei]AYV25045.1 type III secretion system protein [Vibrio mediterranei]MCG9790535.1 type III secretion system protein [Vibrio mediterranei]
MSTVVMDRMTSEFRPKEEKNTVKNMMINEKEWNSYSNSLDKVNSSKVSMNDLLALLAEIIQSSKKLRAQVMKNRITEAVATSDLAVKIAGSKCAGAQRKFGITLAASVATMALTTAATVRMGQTKTLQDKHVVDMTNGKSTSVKSLDAKTVNEFTARLQEGRTSKYRAVSQMSEMGGSMVGNVNEIQYAAQVRAQEESQATKDLKEKFDGQLDQYIQDLTRESLKLNEILDAVAKASLVTNR